MNVPVVLTIAGSDNSGGAGIQADLKTFSAFQCYGTSAITCIVAERPGRVQSIEPVSSRLVREQIELVAEAFKINAFKTGMLYSQELIHSVVESIENELQGIPFILDPVMVSSSGTRLLKEDAIETIKRNLIPKASLVTPNLDEAALLWGESIESLERMKEAGEALFERYRVPFLMKGGHFKSEFATDLLVMENHVERFVTRRIPDVDPHGTGCTYSAAIVAGLARGLSLIDSTREAKTYITRAITNHFQSNGHQVLNHLSSIAQ